MESKYGSFFDGYCNWGWSVEEDIQKCPFLKNIKEPTDFSFSSVNFNVPVRGGAKGPIFEDGPNFEMAFRHFHGQNGVVPLSGRFSDCVEMPKPERNSKFDPLAAKAATISLSAFGGGPFGFDFFSKKWNKKSSSNKGGDPKHESLSNEWLETGQCPIAKSYRAVSGVLPLVAKVLKPPEGVNLRCPPIIVAARAAISKTAFAKNLRPQPLPTKVMTIALLGMAANVPLGVWREHTKKFSPQWFIAIHAAVPFIGMLRKSVLMPKTAMAFTIAASILGQTIGSRAERFRLRAMAKEASGGIEAVDTKSVMLPKKTGKCSVEMAWDPLGAKADSLVAPTATSTAAPTASICY